MINLGLAGAAGSGKDTVADHLVRRYGFVKYSFSDALYREVTEAFGLEDDSLLRQRETKELRDYRLKLDACSNLEFYAVARWAQPSLVSTDPLSPRQVLQWWGTEYRRAQDPDYWLLKAQEWITSVRRTAAYPEQKPQYFVNTSVRFPNERAWIHRTVWDGSLWHIRREGLAPVNAHESEVPLPVLEGERELWNNSDVSRLQYGVDLLLKTSAKFVRCEPMLPYEAPPEEGPVDTRTEDQITAEANYAKGH